MEDQGAKQGVVPTVDSAAYGRPRKPFRSKQSRGHATSTNENHCTRCGKEPHNFDRCPAKGKRCRKCNKIGHFKNCCKSKVPMGKRLQEVNCNMEELFLGAIDCPDKPNGETWSVCLPIHGCNVRTHQLFLERHFLV